MKYQNSPLRVLQRSHTPWLALVAVLVGSMFVRSDNSLAWVSYALYLTLVIWWPGCLLWHIITARQRDSELPAAARVLEVLCCGAALGFAVELVFYVSARAMGYPRLYVLGSFAVALALTAYRWTQRAHGVRPRAAWSHSDTWAAMALVGIIAYLGAWVQRSLFQPLRLGGTGLVDPDEMFHLALVGELRHHFPATYPYVDYPGALTYQWFVHAHMAATSWTTGLDPEVLYRRLDPLVLAILATLGVAALAVRLSGNVWSGPLAASILVLIGSFDITGTTVGEAAVEERFLHGTVLMHSPTQTFAYVMTLPLLALSFALLRSSATPRVSWIALGLVSCAVAGVKVTFLPLYVCGFIAVVALRWRTASASRAALAALLVVGVILTSSTVLYGADGQSLEFSPLQTAELYMSRLGASGASVVEKLVYSASLMAMWLVPASGAVGLMMEAETRRDPVAIWLLGAAASGYGATFLLGHGGNSQLYFGRAANVLVTLLGAWGLTVLFRSVPRRAIASSAIVAAAAGFALFIVRLVTESWRSPHLRGNELVETPVLRIWMNLPALVILVLLLLIIRLLVRDLTGGRRTITGRTIVVLLVGLGLARPIAFLGGHTEPPRTVSYTFPDEGRQAALWLRENSNPGDRIITNAHCGPTDPPEPGESCDSRHFWMSAISERRFLVEGWAYTARSGNVFDDFWGNPKLLSSNDRLFTSPEDDRIQRFVRTYGGDWILLDGRYPAERERLDALVTLELRFAAGEYRVYEVKDRVAAED